jgi:glycosyltransferase involved in cell wall biosynthesis
MRRVAEDGILRRELSARGLERAKAFSWNECAKTTLEVYREAAAKGPLRLPLTRTAGGSAA